MIKYAEDLVIGDKVKHYVVVHMLSLTHEGIEVAFEDGTAVLIDGQSFSDSELKAGDPYPLSRGVYRVNHLGHTVVVFFDDGGSMSYQPNAGVEIDG